MKMFKVTKSNTWTDRNGNVRNFIKYMKSESIQNVILHFGTDNILKVEECDNIWSHDFFSKEFPNLSTK